MAKAIGPIRGWKNRQEKEKARQKLLADLPLATSALFMPAAECLCVEEALMSGAINHKTHLLAVEKEPPIFRKMRITLRQLDLHRVDARNEMLHEVQITRPLDLVFIDLCGSITEEISDWMANVLTEKLLPNATFILAFSEGWRNNHYIPSMMAALNQQPAFITAIIDEMGGRLNRAIALDIGLLRLLLKEWTFKVHSMTEYCDTIQMCAYRLYDFVKRETPLAIDLGDLDFVKTSDAIRNDPTERDWKPIQFSDIPDRTVLEVMTLDALRQGVSNSDSMREVIRRKRKFKMDDQATVSWTKTPTGKFINEHAHVLRSLVMRGIIVSEGKKEYTLNE